MHQIFEEELLSKIKTKNEAKQQESKVEFFLDKCQVKNTDELLAVTDLEHIPKDMLISMLKTALPHRAKLKNFVQYVNCLSQELTSRGYDAKKLIGPLI
jgi:hypothetical protein